MMTTMMALAILKMAMSIRILNYNNDTDDDDDDYDDDDIVHVVVVMDDSLRVCRTTAVALTCVYRFV